MIYIKEGVNDEGVKFHQVEETVIYYLESETDLEKVIKKINKQVMAECGREWLDIENEKRRISSYPEEYVVDIHEMYGFADGDS